jgi:hypothetical protein
MGPAVASAQAQLPAVGLSVTMLESPVELLRSGVQEKPHAERTTRSDASAAVAAGDVVGLRGSGGPR